MTAEKNKIRVPFSYLDRQFADLDSYLSDLKEFVKTGDFTLGKPLVEFENRIAKLCQVKHAIGVGTGTDAIALVLKGLGVGPGDEVITTTNTFIATVGAIVQAGATPVFVDSEDGFVIDPDKIEAAITKKTKALLPVHYGGNVADLPKIMKIAAKHKLPVIEDACQAQGAAIDGKSVGSWGVAGCFSFHPLKNINVWSDGGMIVTNDDKLAKWLRLYRNHGLVGRDEVEIFGINCRFDATQAVIGNRLLNSFEKIIKIRLQNAAKYDKELSKIKGITVPKRRAGVQHTYHLYIVRAEKRDALLKYLIERGVEAKVHYPIPVHLQKAAKYLGYKKGDFPVCEKDCGQIITLPVHSYLTQEEIDYAIDCVRSFYSK